jgi:hypothetical protein
LEHPGIFTTKNGSEVAQKALFFGDDIQAMVDHWLWRV